MKDESAVAACLNGARLICGFKTVDKDSSSYRPLEIWADKMTKDDAGDKAETVARAWGMAVEAYTSQDLSGLVIAETWSCFNDYLWGQGSTATSDPTDDTKFSDRTSEELTSRGSRGHNYGEENSNLVTKENIIMLMYLTK